MILLYLESFGNPRRFARIARRVSQRKPIVAIKSGRTRRAAGRRARTRRRWPPSDVAVDALFRQTGVIRAETLEEMFDLAALPGQSAAAARRDAWHRHQRRRAGHPLRGRVRGRRPGRPGTARRQSRQRWRRSCRRRQRRQPDRHDRLRPPGQYRRAIEAVLAFRRGRCADRDLHSGGPAR